MGNVEVQIEPAPRIAEEEDVAKVLSVVQNILACPGAFGPELTE